MEPRVTPSPPPPMPLLPPPPPQFTHPSSLVKSSPPNSPKAPPTFPKVQPTRATPPSPISKGPPTPVSMTPTYPASSSPIGQPVSHTVTPLGMSSNLPSARITELVSITLINQGLGFGFSLITEPNGGTTLIKSVVPHGVADKVSLITTKTNQLS